jgi:hypothetical protein
MARYASLFFSTFFFFYLGLGRMVHLRWCRRQWHNPPRIRNPYRRRGWCVVSRRTRYIVCTCFFSSDLSRVLHSTLSRPPLSLRVPSTPHFLVSTLRVPSSFYFTCPLIFLPNFSLCLVSTYVSPRFFPHPFCSCATCPPSFFLIYSVCISSVSLHHSHHAFTLISYLV